MAKRRTKPVDEVLHGTIPDLETLTQVRQVERGELAGIDATSPAAKRRAAELAAEGARPVLDKRVSDASRLARIRATTPDDSGLTPQQKLEAGYGTGTPRQPQSPAPKVNGTKNIQAAVEAARSNIQPNQAQIGYWTNPATLVPPRPGEPAKPSAREITSALQTPVMLRQDPEHFQQYGPLRPDAQGYSTSARLDPGQVYQLEDDETIYRNDPGNNQVPVVWDATRKDWFPRDEFIAKAAEKDFGVKRAHDKLLADRRAVEADESLTPEERVQARSQLNRRANALARGLPPQQEDETPQQMFQKDTVSTPHGIFAQDPESGEWKKLADPPDDEGEKRLTQFQKGWLDIYKGLSSKNIDTGETIAPDPAEVEKVMSMMRQSYQKFQGQDAGGGGDAGVAASQPANPAGVRATATNGKGETIYLIGDKWLDANGQPVQ